MNDVATLFLVTIDVEVILGLLLLLVWVQNREIDAALWWVSAHMMRAGSIVLYGLYGELPNLITIDVANALVLCSFALTWSGARVFGGRSVLPFYIGYGAAIWLALAHIATEEQWPNLRALASVAIVATYAWLTAYELWRGNTEGLISRWPAIFVLFADGAMFLLRTPVNAILPWSPATQMFGSIWPSILSVEALLFTISITFILMAMVKERTEQHHRVAATVDQLTGIANRRGFLSESERLHRQSDLVTQPYALLLIDLDNFKTINDRFGHGLGDDVLRLFARTVSEIVSPADLFGRLGGEEFAVVVAETTPEQAHAVAERIRTEFAAAAMQVNGHQVGATLSIGLVMSDPTVPDITGLLVNADRALYRAKTGGRNRVEVGSAETAWRHNARDREFRDHARARSAA